jgi:hypothetical protein
MSEQKSSLSSSANLPLFAVIGSVLMPLAGIVLGHISLSMMKKGQIPSTNRMLAVIALVIGYIYSAVLILVMIVNIIDLIYIIQYDNYDY